MNQNTKESKVEWHEKEIFCLPPRRFREAMLSLFSTNAPPDHGLETYCIHKAQLQVRPRKRGQYNKFCWVIMKTNRHWRSSKPIVISAHLRSRAISHACSITNKNHKPVKELLNNWNCNYQLWKKHKPPIGPGWPYDEKRPYEPGAPTGGP